MTKLCNFPGGLANNVFVGFIISLIVVSYVVEKTNAQKEKDSVLIEKLRKFILPRIPSNSYLYEFTKHDLYLLRWLETNSFNVDAAEKQMMNHLKWRKEQNMDQIEAMDWSEYRKEYPIFTDTWDKRENPVGEAWFSDWEVRQAVVTGQTKKLNRWVSRLAEIQTRRLYGAREAGRTNVTHALLLWDLQGFNLHQHGCSACTSIYLNMCNVYETHYPGLWGGILLLNMNQAFDSILTTMQPFLKPSTKKIMISFYSRRKWLAYLEKLVDKRQRSARFGGKILRNEYQ